MPESVRAVQTLLRLLPDDGRPAWHGLVVGVGCTVAGTILRLAIDPYVEGVPYITFFPLVAVASLFGGVLGGAVCTALSVIVGLYLWVPPEFSLAVKAVGFASGAAFVISASVIITTVYLLNEAVQALRRSEARASLIAREMQHRVKNALQVVQSISTMTVGNATSAMDHQVKLNARIDAFAQAIEVPRRATHLPVDLKQLVSKVLQPFDHAQIELSGPDITLSDETGSMLGLALHELATNASKYGALSSPSGSVEIQWRSDDGKMARLEWSERGGPPVIAPAQTGFGSKLLSTAFTDNGSATSIVFEPTGVRCVLTFPVSKRSIPQTPTPPEGTKSKRARFIRSY